ncbi:MAG TPA: FAD-dependent oxidoreductase [Pirellulales bacterium]|nr:FAD-dependent oxidoreductase [Pirellulales bacterium]
MGKRIVILGSSFAGLTAAVRIKRLVGDRHDVLVLSKSDEFLFMPSLIWVPFDLRTKEEITFPVRPIFEKKGIEFKHTPVSELRLAERRVITPHATESYDYLVIATGPKLNYDAVPGLGPQGGHTQSIFCWEDAVAAGEAFQRFVESPGPVVIGAVQGASCFGAAYEFLFNMAYQLRKRGIAEKAPLTYVTAEPYLAHFGLGGFGAGTKMTEYFFRKQGITGETNAAFREIKPGEIHLEDGRTFPFAYAMLAPSFLGVDAVRACKEITTPTGFVKVNDHYQTEVYPDVFAAGVAVAMAPPDKTPVPCGVPKTGYLSEQMAEVVAHNIAASIDGHKMISLPPGSIDAKCVLDAGNSGIIMSADHFLEPRKHAWLIPGPEAHWAKLAFEKYFLATHRHGWI